RPTVICFREVLLILPPSCHIMHRGSHPEYEHIHSSSTSSFTAYITTAKRPHFARNLLISTHAVYQQTVSHTIKPSCRYHRIKNNIWHTPKQKLRKCGRCTGQQHGRKK